MLISIAYIELKKNLKSPALYIFSFTLFLGALLFTFEQDPNTVFMGLSHGKEYYNSPILIAQLATRLGVIGILFTMLLVGRAVAKDFEADVHEVIFSFPVSKLSYLGGRFLGSFVANILVFLGLFAGVELSVFALDMITPGLCGPFRIGAYLLTLLVMIIPNLLLTGSILFRLATISRKMNSTYMAAIGLLGFYGIAIAGFRFIDSDVIKILFDPFGINGLNIQTKFWTIADMNNNMIPLSLTFIVNRLLWIGVSIFILVRTYTKFQFIAKVEDKAKSEKIVDELKEYYIDSVKPTYTINFAILLHLKQCLILSFGEFIRIIKHPAFIILTILAVSQILMNFVGNLGVDSASVYPFTSWYLKQTFHLWMYMLPLAILFGGMLVWKEKDSKTDEIYNVLPLPNWFGYFTKFFALVNIQVFYLLLAIVAGVFTQTIALNFYDIELGLYFKQLFGIDFINYVHMLIVVLLIQTLSPNKFLGFFFSALYFVVDLIVFGSFGFENILFHYGNVPKFIYSNLNGFGRFSTTIAWYTLYWALFGLILVIITILMWRRTSENNLRYRFKLALRNISKLQITSILLLLILFVSTGSYISYNKHILNRYLSSDDIKKMKADYEVKFQKYSRSNQPTIKHIDLKLDLFPYNRRVKIQGTYQLENNTKSTIDTLFVNLNDWNFRGDINFGFSKKSEQILHAKEYGFRIYKIQGGIKSGEKIDLNFEYLVDIKGFTDNLSQDEIAKNGTYLVLSGTASDYFPVIGYNYDVELTKDFDRKKFGLQSKPDLPSLENADKTKALFTLSRVTYDATISTSTDQIAITNGSLVKNWEENNRNYFHYKSDSKMMNEIAIISGRYEVKRENHKGVNVEVYYDKKHYFNVDRIISGLKDSYDYCTENFSKFPYNDLRVVEVPDYMREGAARHLPTLIIWGETSGFITNLNENHDKTDEAYGIAAHENGHHWWAGIVTPAFAEGGYMLSETQAQYVMVMTLEKKFGKQISRRYLKNEMKNYLSGRKRDLKGEKPLSRSSFQQQYIGYKKSSVAMYALRDYIGEAKVSKAMSRIVKRFGERIDTFALASDLIAEFNKVTPDSLKYLVDDLFNKITIYENEISKATCKELTSGKFQIDLELKAAKFYLDGIGNQTEAPLHDYIYVALLDDKENEYYYQKHLFDANQKSIRIITDKKPTKAGIDPFMVLIDRDGDNNVIKVGKEY